MQGDGSLLNSAEQDGMLIDNPYASDMRLGGSGVCVSVCALCMWECVCLCVCVCVYLWVCVWECIFASMDASVSFESAGNGGCVVAVHTPQLCLYVTPCL